VSWTVLIAEDEPLARRKARSLLAGAPWVTRVAEAVDGPSALGLLEELKPELAILDIVMPGMTGIEVLRRCTHRPRVIFATAYDRYAVTAFELQAVDYLLKPFGRARFAQALERARSSETDDGAQERAGEALVGRPLERLFVRERGRIVAVAVAEIVRVEAQVDYAMLITPTRRHLVHVTMDDLEARLDPANFLRVHRSHIVNLDWVAAMTPGEGSRLDIRMKDGSTVVASRRRSAAIRGSSL
jgi:two-component system LytT family response regulator